MEQLQWIVDNWAVIAMAAGALVAVLSIVNKYTPHASEGKRWWSRLLLGVLDLAALIKRTPAPDPLAKSRARILAAAKAARKPTKRGRNAGGLMALALALSLGAGGCATTGIDPCTALDVAQSSHQVAKASAELVCKALPAEKRRKCEAEAAKAAQAGAAALAVAKSVIKICTSL